MHCDGTEDATLWIVSTMHVCVTSVVYSVHIELRHVNTTYLHSVKYAVLAQSL